MITISLLKHCQIPFFHEVEAVQELLHYEQLLGISEKDEECYRKAKDVEEFENVNAVARPAATKMRTHKMKWKKKDEDPTEVSARDAEKGEKSFADFSDEMADDVSEPKSGSEEIDKTADIKARAGLSKQNTEGSGTAESVTEVRILIIRIEELELANKKLKLQMKRLRKRLREKDKMASNSMDGMKVLTENETE
ncbi:hypothetical protein GCK32_012229 [Trichostrongylus colubriformis]|uniref:Uncharacterized protein n=2 Tax=Trichostrongylus colubriformis TaxID=6319 RepID=A0AAN8F2G0_TRICO